MSKRANSPSKFQRLVRSIKALGPGLGWRYWKLENACERDPTLKHELAIASDAAAYRCEREENWVMAGIYHRWADTLRTHKPAAQQPHATVAPTHPTPSS